MKKVISLFFVLFPISVFALTKVTDVNSLKDKLIGVGNIVIYLLVSLAVIYVVWNVVVSVIYGSDPSKKTEALKNIGYGILGLAIIVSLWGLVNILVGTFPTNSATPTGSFPTANFIKK